MTVLVWTLPIPRAHEPGSPQSGMLPRIRRARMPRDCASLARKSLFFAGIWWKKMACGGNIPALIPAEPNGSAATFPGRCSAAMGKPGTTGRKAIR
jgi:hypothetical protein